jgi:uncharacterized protein
MRIITFYIMVLALFVSCTFNKKPKASDDHIMEINSWHEGRVESLKSESGWLTLAGLFWLKEGVNTFGGNRSNDVDFPIDKAPDKMGSFKLNNGEVSIKIRPGIEVLLDKEPVSEMLMKDDSQDGTTILQYKTLSWYIIKRGERFGVRLKDSTAKTRTEFEKIDRFPVDSTFRVSATFQPYESPKKINVPTAAGETEELSPGLLEFQIGPHKLSLEPLGTIDSDRFFIIFGDETSGKETYGGGRFLYIENPGKAGETVIDFNKAYNPPCVFTPYATCPLPPDQNRLAIKITAGEKNYGHH